MIKVINNLNNTDFSDDDKIFVTENSANIFYKCGERIICEGNSFPYSNFAQIHQNKILEQRGF